MEEVLKLYIFPNMRDRGSSIFFPAAPLVVVHENMLHTRRRGGGGFPRDCSDAGGNFQLAAPENFFSGGCCMRFSRTYTLFVAMRLSVFQVEARPGSRRPVSFVTSQLDRSIIPLTGKGLCGFLTFLPCPTVCVCPALLVVVDEHWGDALWLPDHRGGGAGDLPSVRGLAGARGGDAEWTTWPRGRGRTKRRGKVIDSECDCTVIGVWDLEE